MPATLEEIQNLKRRWEKAEGRLQLWRSVLDTAYHFTRPNHNMWAGDYQTEGTDRTKTVYDLTPMKAVSVFAARMHNILTPPFFQWASMQPGHEVERYKEDFPDQVKGYEERLQRNNQIMFDHIWSSNFDLEIQPCYSDLAVGTAAIMLREGDDEQPLDFHCVNIREIAFEENAKGMPTNVWRFYKEISRAHLQKLYPDADFSKIPPRGEKDPHLEKLDIVESTVELPKGDGFQFLLIDKKTNAVLLEKKLKSSPWIVFRFSRFPEAIIGFGPVLQAFASILTINKMVQYELIGNAFRATPAWTGYADDVFNPWTTRIEPNTIIPINPMSADSSPLRALEMAGDVRFTQLQLQEMRQQINDVMMANPLGQPLGPVKTATEFIMRRQQLDEETSIAIGRLMSELIRPLLKRVKYILERKGILEPMPEINGKTVTIKFETPLANAQNLGNAEQFLNFFQSLAAVVGPQKALMTIKQEDVANWMAEQFSVNESLLKSKEEMELTNMQIQELAQMLIQSQMQAAGNESTPA